METCVTPLPWRPPSHGRSFYGTPETYNVAADWLRRCAAVADWGGGFGAFGNHLPPSVAYTVVDGTQQAEGQVLADLMTYREPSDGILLRHVLEHVQDWRLVLANAMVACQSRLVLVTFTPAAVHTHIAKQKSGWPVWHFNPDDLIATFGVHLSRAFPIETTHPEHVYLVEKR